MSNKFSTVLRPEQSVVEMIKEIKENLRNEIGDYKSWNSEAHITLNTFYASNQSINHWYEYLSNKQLDIATMALTFNRKAIFSNRAFVLLPSEDSAKELIAWMKVFHKNAPFPILNKSIKPHLTIGRKLNDEQIQNVKILDVDFSIKIEKFDLLVNKLCVEQKKFMFEKLIK